MNVIYNFAISDKLSGYISVSNKTLKRIESIYPNPGKNPNLIGVKLSEGSPELVEILKIIKDETGLVPQRTSNYKEETGVFRCYRWREYEERDYDESEFLQVSCATDVATPAGREFGNSGRWVVHYDHTYRPKRRFGCAQTDNHVPMVNDDFMRALQNVGIPELRFSNVLTKPSKPENTPGLWQIYSSVLMPPVLNRLRTRFSKPFYGDPVTWEGVGPEDGIHFEDGPYVPAEAKYRRSEVEGMGEFDIAQMHEKFGSWISSATHPIIISQRFRKILNKLKVSDQNFVPVRLVD